MSRFVQRFRWFPSAAAGVAAVGLILPAGVFAADVAPASAPATVEQRAQVLDIALGQGGVLSGQVVDGQGLPMPGTVVTLRTAKGQVASSHTDTDGRFQVHGLGGGLYEVTAAEQSGTFRLWTAEASPPSAVKEVMLVAGGPIARGQYFNRGQWFGGTGSLIGGVIILGSLGGVVAGGIIAGLQTGGPAS
ncbi:MAG TPA: carboxypeptidase-like regulatory domain-containing protein [Pirellulales bacterium]|jgi:hypothetical protein|nr:carboxypeptidase-like regulatory domain-containing protein [Pirellulales bacterium]